MELESQATKEINDAVNLIISNCHLQINGVDVAPMYVAGKPGAGKTQVQHNLCKQYDWGLVSTHFAMKPIEETGGIPQFERMKINGDEILGTIWSFPDIMGSLFKLAEKHEMVIWLLDDMHLCTAIHMTLLYELLTERKLREYHLPENVAIVLAGNFGSNKAGAKSMFSAIINRVTMMHIFTSYDGWKKNFAMQNNIHPAIQSFLGNDKYQQFFHEEEQVDAPWGSPRSWTRLSNILTALEEWFNTVSEEDCLVLAQGHVSKNAASEFLQYYKIFTKFDVPKILGEGKNYTLPESPVDKYALAYALCSHLSGLKERKSVNKPFAQITYKYLKDHPDLGIMIIHELLDMEQLMNRRTIYTDIAKELNEIEPGITHKLLKDLSSV